jgi:dephospho-CoA kinase
LRLVISGGIGSGKSTVASRLRALGAHVIEADLVGHEVLEPGGAAYESVTERWPSVVIGGVIDRGALAEIVFADVGQLRELEALTHPAIAAEIRRRVAGVETGVIAVELPVGSDLVGTGWVRVIVEAPVAVRLARSVARGQGEEDVRNRMDTQPSREEWRSGADYVIANDGTRAELMARVDELWAELMSAEGALQDGGYRIPDTGQESPES